ncbi:MAG: potassium channel family protein [Thermoproteota archaeon]|nr:potassium channel family protein [Thermoproteota archaeon]
MNKWIDIIVASLTVISLVIVLIDYILTLSTTQKLAIYIFDLIVVILLAWDFSVRVKASSHRGSFILRHWYEFPAMLPLILYTVGDASLFGGVIIHNLRIITLFRVIRLYNLLSLIGGSEFILLAGFSIFAIVFGAIGIYLVEPGSPGANIKNLDDAFWWSVSTISTVGYGDVYPVTTEGRIIATIIMFAGIGILGTFISTVGARLISEKLKKDVPTVADETKRLIKERINKIELLNQKDFDLLIRMMNDLREEKRI